MVKNICIALDGSPFSNSALDTAIEIAKRFGAELNGVHIVQVGAFPPILMNTACPEGDDSCRLITEMLENEANEVVEASRARAAKMGIEMDVSTRRGHPGDEIISFAEEKGADLIVLGSRGKSQVKRLVLGSVSTFVVTHSPVSTLVVKP